MHVEISLGSEFQFKQTILNFWTKVDQKGNSDQKQKN